MQICKRCVLNDNIPSVRINGNGLCNHCTSYPDTKKHTNSEDEIFPALIDKYRHKKYQVIMAYSGGKDSSYTLKLLREKYDISILAVTFNNGFLSDSCMENINTVTDCLGVESMIIKYPVDKLVKVFKYAEENDVFPIQSLERASSICNLCITFVKNMIYYEAIIRSIPVICFGWTPGQVKTVKPVLKLNCHMVAKMFSNTRNTIVEGLGKDYAKYFLDEEFLKDNEDRIPYHYYPFVNDIYDEGKILDEIRNVGWKAPQNTDANSSNCLLNSYANYCHLNRYKFHPYTFEIGNLVREGFLTREEGLSKLEKYKNNNTLDAIEQIFKNSSE